MSEIEQVWWAVYDPDDRLVPTSVTNTQEESVTRALLHTKMKVIWPTLRVKGYTLARVTVNKLDQ